MTKKDYELIANRIYTEIESEGNDEMTGIGATASLIEFARELANDLKQDNPKFDRDKFLQACGIETPKTKTFTGLGGAVWTVPDED